MRTIALAAMLLASACAPRAPSAPLASAPPPQIGSLPQAGAFDAAAYLDHAIAIARSKALAAGGVDWEALSRRIHAEGDGATSAPLAYPALAVLMNGIGDNHGFLQLTPERSAAYAAASGKPLAYPRRDGTARAADRTFYGRSASEARDEQRGDHVLLPDGANLVIATSLVRDRRGRLYPDGSVPDVATARPAASGSDPTLAAALDWLAARCAVRLPTPRQGP